LPPRLLARHTGTDALFDLLFDVKAKLVVEFRFYCVTAEQRS
jgi:hypothetical protein